MRPGESVFEQVLNGETILIRHVDVNDARILCDYINELSKEKTFIRFQGEQMSLEDEEKYVHGLMRKMEQKESVFLLLFVNGDLYGTSGVHLKEKVEGHVGEFGLSVLNKVRGKGLGKLLMKTTLDVAEENIPNLRIIHLTVFASNDVARSLYHKLGFVEYGRLPEGLLHKETYVDQVGMYKKLK